MKKILCLMCLFLPFGAWAQSFLLPSSFDENQIIEKVQDADGNFVPVDQVVENKPASQAQTAQNPAASIIEGEQKKPNAPQTKPAHRTRQLRAVQKDYGLPKSTFDAQTLEQIDQPSNNATFQTQTMSQAVRDFKRESTSYEECSSTDDPNCRTYEVDENGEVIIQ